MKAYQLQGVGNLQFLDVSYPDLKPGWCLVRVKACGICSSDIPRIYTKGTYHFPTVPGHEISGIVDRVFDEEHKELIGKRVAIFPLIPCKKCEQCMKHAYEMCANYDYIGSRRDGGFAEYVAVPIWNLVVLPDDISFIQGAEFEPLAVAIHAIKRTRLTPRDSLAVVGTGMIALSIALYASCIMQCESVTVIGRSETKRSLVEKIGGVEFLSKEPSSMTFSKVIEAVGSNASISSALSVCAPSGTVTLVGNPEKEITLTQNDYWKILRKQITLKGSWNSSYPSDWDAVKEAFNCKRFKPEIFATQIFDAVDLPRGLSLMRNRLVSFVRVISLW